jgi:Zn-dependent protease with chaperone function
VEKIMNPLSRLTQTQKTLLAILGLPLLVMLLGLWQLQRAPGGGANAAEIVQTQQTLDDLTRLQNGQVASATGLDGQTYSVPPRRQAGQVVIVMGPDGKANGLPLLISQTQQRIAALESSGPWNKALGWLALGAFSLSLAGAVLGGLFLVLIRSMGKKALASRPVLLKSFQSGKTLLPWWLGTVGTLFLLAISCATSFEAVRLSQQDHLSKGDVKLVFIAFAIAAFCVYMGFQVVWKLFKSSRAAFEISPRELRGRSVSEQEAPGLWGFVRDVASRVRAETPDAIVVGLDECFFVTEAPVTLADGAVATGRKLYLPLPYMAFMSKPEVAAVIGHELAHFTGDDTEYSLSFSPIYASAVHNLVTVNTVHEGDEFWEWLTKPMMTLGVFFLDSFDEAVKHWSRKRELAADAMGGQVVNKEAMALALVRLSVLSPRVDEALANCWQGGGQSEEGQGGGVIAETRRLVREKGLDDPRDYLEAEQAHPTDTHPTTARRLEALGVPLSRQLLSFAQDPRGSRLLRELGLEGEHDASARPDAAQNVPVSAALEAEFSSSAKSDREERLAVLGELAALGTETITVFEKGVLVCLAAILAGPVVAALPYLSKDMPIAAKWMFWILGPLATFAGVYLLVRMRKPFITLTPEGPKFANLGAPLPWTAVGDVSAQESSNAGSGGSLTLHLVEDFTPQPFSGDRRVKYRRKQHAIIFAVMGVKGSKMEGFVELLVSYWQGGLARAELDKYKTRQ